MVTRLLKECCPTSESTTPETSTGSSCCVCPVRGRKCLVGASVQESLALELNNLEGQGSSLDSSRDRTLCPTSGVARVQGHRTRDLIPALRQTRRGNDHWRIS
jgi:hypothetical protein